MFDSIIERLISYKRVISQASSKHFGRAFNVIKNANDYIYIISKKIRYQLDIKREYYYLGKYLSTLDERKYDLSKDKTFIGYMDKIKCKQRLLDKNHNDLSSLYKKDKNIK